MKARKQSALVSSRSACSPPPNLPFRAVIVECSREKSAFRRRPDGVLRVGRVLDAHGSILDGFVGAQYAAGDDAYRYGSPRLQLEENLGGKS